MVVIPDRRLTGGHARMSVFVVLALIWAAVLVPPAVRHHAQRRAEFIDSFRAQMGALDDGRRVAASPPAATRRPPRMTARKRRRDILGGLLGAMLGSFVLGFVPSLRIAWVVHLFLVNSFIAYVALLVHHQQVTARRQVAAAPAAAVARRGSEPALTPARP